jgi:Protein of unknown function (DUF2934)
MRRKMQQSLGMIGERVVFTAREHLGAQQQIERRAHELWWAGGCRHGTALTDWLQAESEVLEQFTWAYARRHALRQSSTLESSVVDVKRGPKRLRSYGRKQTVTLNALNELKV